MIMRNRVEEVLLKAKYQQSKWNRVSNQTVSELISLLESIPSGSIKERNNATNIHRKG